VGKGDEVMLAHNDVIANIPVSSLARAHDFYAGKLGLVVETRMEDYCVVYRAGDTRVFIHQNENPVISNSVVATWAVEDMLESLVAELQGNGIVFERIEKEGFVSEGDIYRTEGFKCALFKDPDGNLLALYQPNF
jgi:catechol 2,3-dioxygenase-like lactoylglutathione lyase family enzyme